ncbi:MAG: serine/threonine protein kinase, partial [Bryobacteraceae bacterium]|nr:serine/threonine protein kinase [Bryobacteraceae bacterium]
VSHPNVCRVYDIGEAEGLPFISMEYVDGEDLGTLLQRIGRLPADKALQIARKLCAGVAAAHDRGIIHRDLKPQNIMLNRRGEVIIMDFGLAAIADELRGPEARSGTPAYMSPEQLRGDFVTAKSDIYALGLIIYELFTGKQAFDANSLPEMMRKQESESPVSLTSIAGEADPLVEKAVLRCLRPDPAERPATALAVAAALPGGDPLAAALAAGETPSPEMVAASGRTVGIAAKYAVACTLLCIAALISLPFLTQRTALLSMVPMELPPQVLEQKAREIAASLGHTSRRVDDLSWIWVSSEIVSNVGRAHKGGKRDWSQLLKGESPYRLTYRQSPALLVSQPDGYINGERPPNDKPGMFLMNVSGSGLLRHLEAVVGAKQKMPENPVDEAGLFRAAGFDIAKFEEVATVELPKVPFDTAKAWKGPHPGLPGIDIIVQTATWKGIPVSFSMKWPWARLADDDAPPTSARDTAFQTFSFLLLGIGLFAGAWFARYNLIAGRGDRHGATRLAAFVGLLKLAALLLTLHFVPNFAMVGILFEKAAVVLAECAILWMLYIALEPTVRRNWPHTLITWNRLLAGDWADARVGWHILLGVITGLVVRFGFLARQYTNLDLAGPSWPNMNLLMGTASFLAIWARQIDSAVHTSFIIFFLMCGLKLIVRKDWLAALVASLLVSLQEGEIRRSTNLPLDLTVYVVIIGAFAILLLRLGLVPSIAGILTINTVSSAHVSASYLAWFNSVAVVQILLVISLVVFAGWASQRQRPAPG